MTGQKFAKLRPAGDQPHSLLLLLNVGQQHRLPIGDGHRQPFVDLNDQHRAGKSVARPSEDAGGKHDEHADEHGQLQAD